MTQGDRPKKAGQTEIVSPPDSASGGVEAAPGSSSPSTPGETAAWQAWLDDEGPGLLLYARQQTRDEADAQDIFQEALSECWHRCGHRVPDRSLVVATIRRRAIDLGRSMDSRRRREDTVARTAATWFCGEAEAADTRAFVGKAVRGLPEHLREVLVLRHWNGLSFPEIARITDVPVATATSRHRYALDRLREILQEELQP